MCPAYGKTCYNCCKKGLFGAMCHSSGNCLNFKKQKHLKWNKNLVKASHGNSSKEAVLRVQNPQSVEDSGYSDYGYTYIICKKEIENNAFAKSQVMVNIEGINLKVIIDTGSNADTIAWNHYEQFFKQTYATLDDYKGTAIAYSSSKPLPVSGLQSRNYSRKN